MGNSKNLITYLLLVLARAGSKTKNYLDVKNVIIGFVVSGFGSLAYQYLYQDKQYEWKALLASAVIIFIILAMITFLSFFIQEPAAVYYEQHTKIAKQESIINPEISLDLLPYAPNPNPAGDSWVGVRIINKSGIRSIENCKVRLQQITSLLGTNSFVDNQELPSDLHWSENNRSDLNGFLILQREGEVFLDIARSKDHFQAGFFTLVRGDNFLYFPSGEYSIIFKVHGTIRFTDNDTEKMVDIPPQQYSAKIILSAGFNLRIEEIKKI